MSSPATTRCQGINKTNRVQCSRILKVDDGKSCCFQHGSKSPAVAPAAASSSPPLEGAALFELVGLKIPEGVRTGEDWVYIPKFVQMNGLDPAILEQDIENEGNWEPRDVIDMLTRGSSLNHDRFTLDTNPMDDQGRLTAYCKYSYPGFQWEAMKRYKHISKSKTAEKLLQLVQECIRYKGKHFTYNQVLGTKYHKEDDTIGYHHDKMINIMEETPILSISLGDVREFHLRYDRGVEEGKQPADEIFVLGSGDLFILGPRTNALMKHTIVPVKAECVLPKGRKYKPRTSLVFRVIKTVIPAAQVEREITKARRDKQRRDAKKKSTPLVQE